MTLKAISRIPAYALAALLALTVCCWSCASEGDEPRGGNDDVALLSIRINLANAASPAAAFPASRAGEEYEPDKLPANDLEKMHTVRIIIIDSSGKVEHNSLWDLTASPDIVATGQDFPVSANDTKRIVLVANEAQATVTLPDSQKMPASDYFRSLKASVGALADLDLIKNITFATADNNSGAISTDCLHGPLAMSAIHEYHIGNAQRYSATFTIHRAAAKYTYRISNLDKVAHKVDYIMVNNIASRQYFFPDADFTDESQYFHTAYRTPAGAGTSEITLPANRVITAGETVEIGPFYLPEGCDTGSGNPYATAFAFDGVFSGWRTLEWAKPQTPDVLTPMTDLPRNTHVIVNVSFTYTDFSINYTVCPWNSYDNIVIPPFN